MLTERQRNILRMVVEVFLDTGRPVSSSAVAKKQRGKGLSSASIRTTMAGLEALGLLHQPHTSAGREPTAKGLRTFVDDLMAPRLHPWDRSHIDTALQGEPDAAMAERLGQQLADVSGEVAVVAVPRLLGSTFREVGVTRCASGTFLVYFVSPGGLVQQKVVHVEFDLGAQEVQTVQNMLNEWLTATPVDRARTAIQERLNAASDRNDWPSQAALQIGLRALPETQMEITVEGAYHLAKKPEFRDSARLEGLLNAIERKQVILELLDRILDSDGVQVILGSEHALAGAADLACVGGAWTNPTGGRTAVISLLGPTRMDYTRLVPLVRYATTVFGRYWEQL